MKKAIKIEMEREFRSHMIPFWKNMKDEEQGGYYGLLRYDLIIDKKAEKGCILNSRILWFFSNACLSLRDDSMLEYAVHSYEFLKKAFLDKEEGGVYWAVTYDGRPLDETKHTYCQSFAIYGLSSFYKASGNSEAIDLAYQLFNVIEEKCRDKEGYLESFDRRFVPASNEKLSENGVMAERTMNTLLHVMEAYTELYRVLPDEDRKKSVKDRLDEILDIFRNKVFDPSKRRLEVFFDKEYRSLIDLYSFGHDIEAAWLIDRTIDVLGYKGTGRDMSDITEILTENVYQSAYDGSSMPAEAEEGRVLEDRIWWVECESVVGFLNGYNKDNTRTDYLGAAYSTWQFTKNHIVDGRKGSEWYWGADANGRPMEGKDITDPWKCPYHNGRMYFEVLRRL
ncbi:MAG: AGE family epimerase/isomerase [Eubacterium sp.]|nr:AGE family epimerase/isomerase [Eubacterium sp.]